MEIDASSFGRSSDSTQPFPVAVECEGSTVNTTLTNAATDAVINENDSKKKHQTMALIIHPDYGWSDRLSMLRAKDAAVTHFLAWLSTLGGAYHLCNRPKQAMAIAKMTLEVGHYIYNPRLVLKGYVYLALNYCMLGKSKVALDILDGCLAYIDRQRIHGGNSEVVSASSDMWTSSREFTEANRVWVVNRIEERRLKMEKEKEKAVVESSAVELLGN